MQISDWITLTLGLIGLSIAWHAIRRANKTTSASTLVTLTTAQSVCWERFFDAGSQGKPAQHDAVGVRSRAIADVLNLLELTSAAYLEKSLTGHARQLAKQNIEQTIRLIIDNDSVCGPLGDLIQDESTFEHLRHFIAKSKTQLGTGKSAQLLRKKI